MTDTHAGQVAKDITKIQGAINLIEDTTAFKENHGDYDVNIVRAVMCLEAHLNGERWVS